MRIELLLFLSLMVMIIVLVACSVPRRPSPGLSPTLFPSLTLTPYDPQLIARLGESETLAATVSAPDGFYRDIHISPPHCYASASPMLTCLGTIRNLGRRSYSDLMLEARLMDAIGETVQEQTFTLEQRQVNAGADAAYRLRLPRSSTDQASLDIRLLEARESSPAGVSLILDDERGLYLAEQKQYRFTAVLRNIDKEKASGIRLLVTLSNRAGALVGYRVVDLPHDLPSGGTIDVDMMITPFGGEPPVGHRAALEASTIGSARSTPTWRAKPDIYPGGPASG